MGWSSLVLWDERTPVPAAKFYRFAPRYCGKLDCSTTVGGGVVSASSEPRCGEAFGESNMFRCSTSEFTNVRVTLYKLESGLAVHSGVVRLRGALPLEPLALFQAIVSGQDFARGVAFDDFDVVLSDGLSALYKHERFRRMWRMAAERAGITRRELFVGAEIRVSCQRMMNCGRE